jgi:5-methyltetrahydropteroyltriglutamate--homocysteine methyltransferase
MSATANLGFPRFGIRRELKFALEKYWNNKLTESELFYQGSQLKQAHWSLQSERGIEIIPSNDFSFYDQVLDTAWMFGAIPERFRALKNQLSPTDLYFAMARGWQADDIQVSAMEMTKWFDTNYHYIVPEISNNQTFELNSQKPVDEFLEAEQAGYHTRPVLLGPITFLLLAKGTEQTTTPLYALDALLPVYVELLSRLGKAGASWIQMDEPCLVWDLDENTRQAFRRAYEIFKTRTTAQIMLATYFGGLDDNSRLAVELPVAGLHIDLVRSPDQLTGIVDCFPKDRVLSLGLVDGRNVWRTNLENAISLAEKAATGLKTDRLQIAPSCSLQYCPYDLALETNMNPELISWLAFSYQKLDEVTVINAAINGQRENIEAKLRANELSYDNRKTSRLITDANVQKRIQKITLADYSRKSTYLTRRKAQSAILGLPILPTTTIGSFPQTDDVRKQRALFNTGKLQKTEYDRYLQEAIARVIHIQEGLGLDVLVHGEFERTDMVEYFAEKMSGFAFTEHGWVQSYGSRGVRPPIIFGDVSRPEPMTVEWAEFAQSCTANPVKGMLTGPITIMKWSFVRDDQPLEKTGTQIALALRDEVCDLEKASIKVIQIDEPALREGLPLRQSAREEYLSWAVDCFRLAAGVAADDTQIHTHMCYGEFADIMNAIVQMDADVISIEASRSGMELLKNFQIFSYPNDIGPGIYDIHSPRVPTIVEYTDLIQKALQVIPADRLWINPDCGLKTRRWEEVIPALKNMVEATRLVRTQFGAE